MAPVDTSDSSVARRRRPAAVVVTVGTQVPLCDDDEVTFGRGEGVTLEIGHEPVHDELVPHLAGAFFVRDSRVVVANHGPRLAFDIAVPGRPLVSLAPEEWHAPAAPSFTVMVQGTVRYDLGVTSSRDRAGHPALAFDREATREGGHDATRPGVPHLTERQRAVLDAYVAPLTEGRVPATHQQVADALGVARQTIRLECNNIWAAFFAAGVPMRDRRDTRDAITDAWARHRL